MRIAVLGTGMVGDTLASRLAELGHEVAMGSRDAAGEKVAAWAARTGGTAATFADAAAHGDLIINATSGSAAIEALELAQDGAAGNLDGKVVIDVTNPLDFSQGFPPSLFVPSTDSLGERIQRAFPAARVVKSLNTVNANVMVHPELIPGDHVMFVAGEDAAAKATVTGLLGEFGWPAARVHDLGGIMAARGQEAYLLLWLTLYQTGGTPNVNLAVLRSA